MILSVHVRESIDCGLYIMYIINICEKVRFDSNKAILVKAKHNVDMETVKQEILAGRFVTRMVRNQVDNAEQRMFLVLVDGYVHCVPFVEELDGTFFLKTAFKSRFYQRRYENGELKIFR